MDEIDITIGEINIDAPPSPAMAAGGERKELFRAGFLTCIIALFGLSNPPTATTATATATASTSTSTAVREGQEALSMVFSVAAYATLASGAEQILLAIAVSRAPRLWSAAEASRAVGMAMIRFTLGYGASLVLLMAASPWFVMYFMFLSLPFM